MGKMKLYTSESGKRLASIGRSFYTWTEEKYREGDVALIVDDSEVLKHGLIESQAKTVVFLENKHLFK